MMDRCCRWTAAIAAVTGLRITYAHRQSGDLDFRPIINIIYNYCSIAATMGAMRRDLRTPMAGAIR
jgi:hypothetical protein